MAGQHEIPLDCPQCADVKVLKADVKSLWKRSDEHKIAIDKIADTQKGDYEVIRKRIHDAINEVNRGIGSAFTQADKDITDVGAKVEDLSVKYNHAATDLALLSRTLNDHMAHSETRHNSLMGIVQGFSTSLEKHMKEEEKTLKEIMLPIRDDLDYLKARWWSVALWAIGALGTGLVGSIVYIWMTLGVNP